MQKSFTCLALLGLIFQSFTLMEDLTDHIRGMGDEDTILFEYSFEGCFGPYHHGSIEFTLKQDTIHYHEKNFDDKGEESVSQSGTYAKSDLLRLLRKADEKQSSEIFGNTITFQITDSEGEVTKGADHIVQRHFIEIFHPLSNVFRADQPRIPGLKNGGFVH